MKTAQKAFDKFFRDKHGKLAVVQKPNTAITVWGAGFLLSKILPYGQLNFLASLIAFGALFTWSWLEMFSGSSVFRRTLGVAVMILLLASHL